MTKIEKLIIGGCAVLSLGLLNIIVRNSSPTAVTAAQSTPMDQCLSQMQGLAIALGYRKTQSAVEIFEDAEMLCKMELEKSRWDFEAKYGKRSGS